MSSASQGLFSASHLLHFIPSLCWDLSQVENRHRKRGWKKLHTMLSTGAAASMLGGKDRGRGISKPRDSCREEGVYCTSALSPNLPRRGLEPGVSSTTHPLYWCHGKGKASRDGQPDNSQVPKWPLQSCSLSVPSPCTSHPRDYAPCSWLQQG